MSKFDDYLKESEDFSVIKGKIKNISKILKTGAFSNFTCDTFRNINEYADSCLWYDNGNLLGLIFNMYVTYHQKTILEEAIKYYINTKKEGLQNALIEAQLELDEANREISQIHYENILKEQNDDDM